MFYREREREKVERENRREKDTPFYPGYRDMPLYTKLAHLAHLKIIITIFLFLQIS